MRNRYPDLLKTSEDHNESRDCTVKALAVMADTSYEDAHNMCHARGRKNHNGMYDYVEHMQALGMNLTRIATFAKTVNQFQNTVLRKDRHSTYLIMTRAHAIAAKGGTVHCHADGSKRTILEVYRVDSRVATNPDAEIKNAPRAKRAKRVSNVNYHLRHRTTKEVYITYTRLPKFAKLGRTRNIAIQGKKNATLGMLELVDVRNGNIVDGHVPVRR